MKVPTFRQIQKKAEQGIKLDLIEGFIIDHYPRNNKEIKKFMQDLQKVVDYVERNIPVKIIHHYDDGLNK